MAAVLIVEDNPEHQAVIAEVVRRLGHEVALAGDGLAGLAAAHARRPDLVIADVDMPHMDGIRMCRALRDDPVTADVPVVLITAYLAPGDTLLAGAEAAAVVPKPFRVKELTETLRACLEAPAPPPPAGTHHAAFVEAMLHSLDTGVIACDLAGRPAVVNQAVLDFFGDQARTVPIQDWVGEFGLRRHDGSPLPPGELPLLRALAGEDVRHAGVLAHDRGHRPRWFSINARPVRDPAGATLGAVAAVHDVTADHHKHRYQRCTSRVLKALVRAPDTTRAAAAVLAAIADELGWPLLRMWLVDEVTNRLRPVATHREPGAAEMFQPSAIERGAGLAGACWERGELVFVPDIHAPGSPVLSEVAASTSYRAGGAVPVRSGDRVVGVLTFFTLEHQEPEPALAVLLSGISGHIGAYLERRRAEELANQLSASIGEYVALVGHELRTPLTSIGTYTDLIAESGDDTTIGEVRELLAVIERNNARLRTLVDRLLDLAALESGHTQLTVSAVDLAAVLTEATTAVLAGAPAPHPEVRTDLPTQLVVPGDPLRLRQVAENLIGNAVKYSPPDATVRVTLTAEDDAAVLTVADTGIGIPAGERDRLFARLYRATNARHSGIPGIGLGLALTRAIVDLHRGAVTLHEGPEGGTTATVRLPRSPGQNMPMGAGQSSAS